MSSSGTLKVRIVPRELSFRVPAKTSRDTLTTRPCWYVVLQDAAGNTGLGECAPLFGLSAERPDEVARLVQLLDGNALSTRELLQYAAQVNAMQFAVEAALCDIAYGSIHQYAPDPPLLRGKTMAINGLVWMNDREAMLREAGEKLRQGFRCIKVKVGALAFEQECEVLEAIRAMDAAVEIRVDANGAFDNLPAAAVKEKLRTLARVGLHSVEQPVFSRTMLRDLSVSGIVPVALDESLIGCRDRASRIKLLEETAPAFVVLKPSLLGGLKVCEEWIELADAREIGWWVTSALESSCGLFVIAQWLSQFDTPVFQGLGTGALFTNNLFSPLSVASGQLVFREMPGPAWRAIFQP
jgi:o-succinylbenzoate synthase